MKRSTADKVTCPGCGWKRRVNTTRGDGAWCRPCLHIYAAAHETPDDSDALPPGRWVTDGLIQRFIPDTSPPSAADRFTAADEEVGAQTPEQVGRVERPGHTAPRPPVACKPIIIAGRSTCHDCGCLLSRSGEICPSCTAWRTRQAVAASWRPDYYKPRQVALKEVA